MNVFICICSEVCVQMSVKMYMFRWVCSYICVQKCVFRLVCSDVYVQKYVFIWVCSDVYVQMSVYQLVCYSFYVCTSQCVIRSMCVPVSGLFVLCVYQFYLCIFSILFSGLLYFHNMGELPMSPPPKCWCNLVWKWMQCVTVCRCIFL